jgi:hypothetical protein
MASEHTQNSWVFYNPLTATYDTRDGTKVARELVEHSECLWDVLHIANIREQQRNDFAMKGKQK